MLNRSCAAVITLTPNHLPSTPQVGALKPTADIAGSPITIAALAKATLDAGGSACYNIPCSYDFVVACSGLSNVTKSGTATTATITTGKGVGYDLNLLTVPAGIACSVTLTVTDTKAATDVASGTLQVRLGLRQCQYMFMLIVQAKIICWWHGALSSLLRCVNHENASIDGSQNEAGVGVHTAKHEFCLACTLATLAFPIFSSPPPRLDPWARPRASPAHRRSRPLPAAT